MYINCMLVAYIYISSNGLKIISMAWHGRIHYYHFVTLQALGTISKKKWLAFNVNMTYTITPSIVILNQNVLHNRINLGRGD